MPSTFYVSPSGSGTACTIGQPCSLDFAVGGGSSPVQPGDTVELATGIYRVGSNFHFGPGGTSPTSLTIYKAAAGARPIITFTDDTPPPLYANANYLRLDGLWMGGTRINTPTGIFMGGSPISNWVQIVNCVIFGYHDGIEVGSAQYYLIQNNVFVNTGGGTFDHSIYASGNDNADGTETNHGIIDKNLFVAGGGGYAVHCFPSNKSMIVTRNAVFGPGNWGVAAYGKEFLIANNFTWKTKHSDDLRPCGEAFTVGYNTSLTYPPRAIVWNNVAGPCIIMGFVVMEDWTNPQATALIKNNGYVGPNMCCYNLGTDYVEVAEADITANLGISATAIDDANTAIGASFAQPLADILNDATIETNLALLQTALPVSSSLYHAGYPWFDANPINIGPDCGAPSTVNGFWETFNALGLKNYDANGNLYVGAGLSGQASLSGKISF